MRNRALAPLAALAVLALAGCNRKAEAPAGSATEEAASAATALPPMATASDVPVPTEIPSALHGRWGLVPADCTSTGGDNKGLLTVDATSLKFYESVAKLGKIESGGQDAIDATFAFSGEGQTWTLDVDLQLGKDGRTLTRKDTGKDAMPSPLEYTRCP
jgi:hypothetical protein